MFTLDPNEKVIRIVRKHWFIFAEHMLGPIIAFVALPTLVLVIGKLNLFDTNAIPFVHVEPAYFTFDTHLFLFGFAIWGLITLMSVFAIWTNFYLDVWILTDKRVIDIEQKGFFRREVSTFRLDVIQDMTVNVDGLLPTILNFGNIQVHTASTNKDFYISGIPEPRAFKQAIRKEHDRELDQRKTDRA
jgi:hypothetical protein